MEITLEGIVALITLFIGGSGLGGLVTWRWLKKKAKAEADQAAAEAKQKEAEAKAAEVEIAQKVQDTYKEMLEDKQKEVDDNHHMIAERDCDVIIQTMNPEAFNRLCLSNDWSFVQIDELEAGLVEKKNGE